MNVHVITYTHIHTHVHTHARSHAHKHTRTYAHTHKRTDTRTHTLAACLLRVKCAEINVWVNKKAYNIYVLVTIKLYELSGQHKKVPLFTLRFAIVLVTKS